MNLSHNPIPEIGWPAMTMEFPVAPSIDLKAIKPGTRVNFTIEQQPGRHVRNPRDHAGGRQTMTSSRPPHTRRWFMQGAAAAGALSLDPLPSAPRAGRPPAAVLSGTEFALEIETVPLTINGRQATATGVNGQVPAPILRWREGDTVTLAVTNRLSSRARSTGTACARPRPWTACQA